MKRVELGNGHASFFYITATASLARGTFNVARISKEIYYRKWSYYRKVGEDFNPSRLGDGEADMTNNYSSFYYYMATQNN